MPANDLSVTVQNDAMPRRWPTALATALFFAFTFVFFCPLYLFFSNAYDFTFSFSAVFPILFLLALFLTAVVFTLAMIWKDKVHEKSVALIFALAFLLWLQGNILLWDYGPLDGRTILWETFRLRGLIDILIWGSVIILALVKSRTVCRWARIGSLAFLLIQIISVGTLGLRAPERDGIGHLTLDMNDQHLFSSKKNVIVLVLDSFQSDAFQELIRTDPPMQGNFQGFHLFSK